jgi:putative tricarboxylic transport membrane protein
MGRQQHYLSGLFFIVFGALAVWAGNDLTIGTAADMGIGYTPRALAIGCIGVGCVLMAQGYRAAPAGDGHRVEIAWRPLLLVTIMVIGFAVLLPRLGLPLTVAVMTAGAAASGETFNWTMLALIAVGMAVMSLLLFSTALNLQIPVWPF